MMFEKQLMFLYTPMRGSVNYPGEKRLKTLDVVN